MKLLRLTKTMLSCVAALSTLLTLYATLYRHPVQVVNHWHATDPAPLTDEYCARHPDPGNIVITVKTGATEAFQKLPSQLVTSLRCSKKLLVFSDLEQRLGSHRLHDALSNFSSKAMEKNEDFDIYRLQQRYAARGFETEINELKSIKDPRPSWRTAGHNAAWALDKYKFLHIVEKAWELAPDQDFYVFIEADTYLVWSNLLRYLATLDASQPLYLGKPVHMREHPRPGPPFYFGYGGSGLILSGATMRKFAVVKQGLASRWDNRIKDMWFGDYLLAAALEEELAITLTDASPMLNADKPAALPFGPTLWCQPVMTLHHMSVTDTQSIWEVEKTLGDVCMTFADVHSLTYADRGFAFKKSSWDNLSYDKSSALEAVPTGASTLVGLFEPENAQDPNASFEACELACIANSECFQFSHMTFTTNFFNGTKSDLGGKCYLSKTFRLGSERVEEPTQDFEAGSITSRDWVSGWRNDRIAKWVAQARCPPPEFGSNDVHR